MKPFFYTFLIGLMMSCSVLAAQTIAEYEARGAGMRLMSGTMMLDEDKHTVSIETKTQTRGLLSVLLDARTTLLSEAVKQPNSHPVMKKSSMESVGRRKIKTRTPDFSDKPEMLDYQTAVFDLMTQPAPQNRQYIVFDGKRKMKFSFNYQGIKDVNLSESLIYSGPVDYYTLYIEVLEGKKNGWFFKRVKNKNNPPLHLYFAHLENEPYKRLVRAEFETTLFGTISINLLDLREVK